MYPCSNLVHHENLISPERMLVSYSDSFRDTSLCSYLESVDKREYQILREEDSYCSAASGCNQVTWGEKAAAVSVGIFAGFFGGMLGALTSGPYGAATGAPTAGVSATAGVIKIAAIEHQREACTDISTRRLERLEEKVRSAASRATKIKKSWFGSSSEIKQLEDAASYFSHSKFYYNPHNGTVVKTYQ